MGGIHVVTSICVIWTAVVTLGQLQFIMHLIAIRFNSVMIHSKVSDFKADVAKNVQII